MSIQQTTSQKPSPSIRQTGDRLRNLERRAWVLLLILVNLSLLNNVPATALIYDPAAVNSGEWWRLFTWPLVHVSRYHLLLDGTAFLLLLHGIEAPHPLKRINLLVFSAIGSLVLPLLANPTLAETGLCGLSGIAHGLATYSALEMIGSPVATCERRKIGLLLLAGLLGKSAFELWTGQVLFASLHIGSIGTPVVETHAGGLLGGVMTYLTHQTIGRRELAKRLKSA